MDLAHACIKTRNLDKTESFYTEILGMEKVFEFHVKGNRLFKRRRIGFYLKAGERTFIEVFRNFGLPRWKGKVDHLCFAVEDIDAYEKKLRDHGVATRGKKLGEDNTWQLWFRDNNGIDIELFQYTDRSSQFTGDEVEYAWP